MIRTNGRLSSARTRASEERAKRVGKHLIVDPRVCHGELTFEGTRVPVETILLSLAKGRSVEYMRTSWPEVTPEAIEEAVRLATKALLDLHRRES